MELFDSDLKVSKRSCKTIIPILQARSGAIKFYSLNSLNRDVTAQEGQWHRGESSELIVRLELQGYDAHGKWLTGWQLSSSSSSSLNKYMTGIDRVKGFCENKYIYT